jgi:hypothetical protein
MKSEGAPPIDVRFTLWRGDTLIAHIAGKTRLRADGTYEGGVGKLSLLPGANALRPGIQTRSDLIGKGVVSWGELETQEEGSGAPPIRSKHIESALRPLAPGEEPGLRPEMILNVRTETGVRIDPGWLDIVHVRIVDGPRAAQVRRTYQLTEGEREVWIVHFFDAPFDSMNRPS